MHHGSATHWLDSSSTPPSDRPVVRSLPIFTAGQEQTITLADGRSLTLGRLTVGVLREWRDWIANRIGDPFADVEQWLGKIPEAESMRQLRAAEDLRDQFRFFSLACPVAQRMLATEEGGAKLFGLLLRVKDPKASDDDGMAVAMHLVGEVAEVLAKAEGVPRGNAAAPTT